ncbi:uncharacterized protein LOC143912779 [Arctopsyche grandis]|uniref:uncharacterized protein LOC143912779 n=1 Tax=Arctopsyche grandis TaxID=121162 RepID=UPI00406D6888
MDDKYLKLRKQLSYFGYTQTFPMDCMPLVENLTSDLLETTNSLQHYMQLYKEVLQQRDTLKGAAEPYKCDNAKLIKENNKLHLGLLRCKEDLTFKSNDVKSKIRRLESEIDVLKEQNKSLRLRNQEYQMKSISADTISSARRSVLGCGAKDPSKACSSCYELKRRMDQLVKESADCKNESVELFEKLAFLKCQLEHRDREIERLNSLLQGGRPLSVLRKECQAGDDEKFAEIVDFVKSLEAANENLSAQLKESLSKQHEAMSRAVQMADKNEFLAKKLQETDQKALTAEAECNARLKEKCDQINSLQNKLKAAVAENEDFDRKLKDLSSSHFGYEVDVERNSCEITALKTSYDSAKEMNESLHRENKKLSEMNRRLEELLKLDEAAKCEVCGKLKLIAEDAVKTNQNVYCKCENISKESLIKLIEKERKFYENHINEIKSKLNRQSEFECHCKNASSDRSTFEKLKEERDFYSKEYRALKDKVPGDNFITELQNKICTLEQHVFCLEKDNRNMSDKIATLRSELDDSSGHKQHRFETTVVVDRLEKDLTTAREDLRKIERERDALCDKLKAASNQSSYRDDLLSRRMQSEEVITSQNLRLQQECNSLRENLKISESEFLHVKTLYNQIKSLQVESDKNVADMQRKVNEASKEMHALRNNLNAVEKMKDDLEYEVKLLKADKAALKDNLTQIDRERDNLVMDVDDKTEKVSSLQHLIRSKDTAIELLENRVTELNRKLELTGNLNATLEHKLHDAQTCSESLSLELDTITKQRDNALIENRRLQSDLAAITADLRSVKREYETSRKEVDEMKQQLQHYVDEVRRIEDILNRKEAERTEMLDHFASLSHEATVLETNNHSLENAAATKNIQLQAASEKAADLERKLKSRESIVEMQEEKISSLMYQISVLETDLIKQKEIAKTSEQMLSRTQEMCTALENQKKSILIGIGETDDERKNLEYNLEVLNRDKRKLEENLTKDKATIESLEMLLAESRREVVELKLSLQDAVEDARKLNRKVDTLQRHLDIVESQSLSSRQRTEEAAKHLQDLQFQMTDERYQRVRSQTKEVSKLYSTGTL